MTTDFFRLSRDLNVNSKPTLPGVCRPVISVWFCRSPQGHFLVTVLGRGRLLLSMSGMSPPVAFSSSTLPQTCNVLTRGFWEPLRREGELAVNWGLEEDKPLDYRMSKENWEGFSSFLLLICAFGRMCPLDAQSPECFLGTLNTLGNGRLHLGDHAASHSSRKPCLHSWRADWGGIKSGRGCSCSQWRLGSLRTLFSHSLLSWVRVIHLL